MPPLVNQRSRSARERRRMTPMTAEVNKRPAAIRVVIPFVFRHWLNQPATAATVAGGLLGATVADLFMPLFSGHLVDAVTLGASDPAARRTAGATWIRSSTLRSNAWSDSSAKVAA